jgi:CRISPR-associated protein Cas2
MMVIVSYDVAETDHGKKRLRKVAKVCQHFGQRVQCSVFECLLDPAQWAELRAKLIAEIEPEHDSLRFYFLGAEWRRRVEHIGAKDVQDPEGPMIV